MKLELDDLIVMTEMNIQNDLLMFSVHFRYVGRYASGSAAAGNKQMHMSELSQFLNQAVSLN